MNLLHQGAPSWKADLSEAAFLFSSPSWFRVEREDTPDSVIHRMNLRGYRRRDLSLEVRGRSLVVRAERTRGLLKPTSRSSFAQTLTLSDTLDEQNIQADFRDGVLTVTVAKKPHARARRIPIQVQPSATPPPRLAQADSPSPSWWTTLKHRIGLEPRTALRWERHTHPVHEEGLAPEARPPAERRA